MESLQPVTLKWVLIRIAAGAAILFVCREFGKHDLSTIFRTSIGTQSDTYESSFSIEPKLQTPEERKASQEPWRTYRESQLGISGR